MTSRAAAAEAGVPLSFISAAIQLAIEQNPKYFGACEALHTSPRISVVYFPNGQRLYNLFQSIWDCSAANLML
jgi:hypothetical protein